MRPLVDTIGSLLERERSTLQALDLALRQCRLDPTAAAEPTAPASEVLAILITPTIGALNCATKKPIQLVGCVKPEVTAVLGSCDSLGPAKAASRQVFTSKTPG